MLVIFDWDGTLIDSTDKIASCLRKASVDCKLKTLEPFEYKQIIGLGLYEAIETLYPGLEPGMQDRFRQSYSRHFIEADTVPCAFFEGVEESLEQIRDNGFKIAVATGKSRNGLSRVLANLGWQDYFHATRCADETASKPDPLMLHELIRELSYHPEESIMVGDTEFDLQMANNAGIRSVAVSYGAHSHERLLKHKPEAILDNLLELPGIL